MAAHMLPTAQHPTRRRLGLALGLLALLALGIWLAIPSSRRWLANPTGQPAQVGVTQISVRGDWFQNHLYAPAVVRVPTGSTVTWTFADRGTSGTGQPLAHNVVGAGWASAVLTTGTYQHTFSAPGLYRYTCTLHTGMNGVVEVVP